MSEAPVLRYDTPEHFDVLIVGAGISGIGGAVHLKTELPGKSFAILDNQDSFGGTWRTHTYPGIRSDSDLYTFGYKFKPWTGAPIATAESILGYMSEVIETHDIDRHIRYRHTVLTASWSSKESLWTLVARRSDTGAEAAFTCRFLWMCQGYYRHSKGYTPNWPGMDRYHGRIVHPQTWPEDLDYAGKQVLVIGSGATAATLVPAMAEKTGHITMLQRSPTYFAPGENRNELADSLRELDIPETWIHEIVRRRILHDMKEVTRRSFEEPEALKAELIAGARAHLGDDFDIDPISRRATGPGNNAWLSSRTAICSPALLPARPLWSPTNWRPSTRPACVPAAADNSDADIIITATGFELCMFGDIRFDIDDTKVDFADTVTWRGMLFSGVPNMCWVFGYLRTSWTMRADLIADFVCRLLRHMDELNVDVVTPTLRSEEARMERRPWVPEENFNAGYLLRGMHLLPKQGTHLPWRHTQDYYFDKDDIPSADLDDGTLVYDAARAVKAAV